MYHRFYYLDIYTLFKFQLPCHLELAENALYVSAVRRQWSSG